MRVARHVPELRLCDLVDPGIEFQHGLSGLGMHGLDIAREREPAAPDVQDIGRRSEPGTERRRRVGEPPHVTELEVGRVTQVDGGVGQTVEHEDPDVRVGGVAADGDAVVGALGVTRGWLGQGKPAGQHGGGDRQRRPVPSPLDEATG